ncbi:MAG: bifunctional riboflavin kinase/FAD synthetase [Pseudomonadales bacterium]|nr:bifunctional riboflavin kinase/FAD synthetase [Pseudomonadales bacterium]
MELIRGLHNLKAHHRGCVATIGNYDGVHRGHQSIIAQVAEKSKELRLPSAVLLFEPQPSEYFASGSVPARIMRFRDKLEGLAEYGVGRVLCVRFNESFRSLSAKKFVDDILVNGMGVRFLVVGDDFHFGSDRRGDFEFLEREGQLNGFEVVNTKTTKYLSERVSSTRIRNALHDSNFELVDKLLGHRFYIGGRVVHGDKIGRTIGVPTANVLLGRQRSPLKGVFAVEVSGIEDKPLPAMASIGNRPTVGGKDERLEVHLLDFKGDLYGRKIDVSFVKKIREEKKFDGLETLKQAIQNDIAIGRKIFNLS